MESENKTDIQTAETQVDNEARAPIDILGDGGIMKLILQDGVGEITAKVDQEVDINFVGTLVDGTEFVREDSHDEPFQIFLGNDPEAVKGIHEALKTMKQGERAEITLKPEYAYGEDGLEGKVAPNTVVIFDLLCIEFRDRTKSKFDFPEEERVPEGIKLKIAGNDLFKAGDLNGAKGMYSQAVEFLEAFSTEEAVNNLVAIYQNMSLIYFKEKAFGLARDEATKACMIQSTAVKAYYRRAQALVELKDFEGAVKDLKWA